MFTSYRRRSGAWEVACPGRGNRDLGSFLVLLGFSLAVLVPRLYAVSPLLGASLLALGALLTAFSHKVFRILPDRLVIRDGLFARPQVYRLGDDPTLVIEHQDPYTVVMLAFGKVRYVLDRRSEESQARSLAEALARGLRCPLVDGEVCIPGQELSLPFRERARLHPGLLGPEVACPEPCSVSREGKVLRWNRASQGTETYLLFLYLLVLLVGALPLFSHVQDVLPRYSFLDLALQEGQVGYFLVTGLALLVLTVFGFAGQQEVEVSPEFLTLRRRLLGYRLSQRSLPQDHLVEIWSEAGGMLHFLSDEAQLACRAPAAAVPWLCAHIRRMCAA